MLWGSKGRPCGNEPIGSLYSSQLATASGYSGPEYSREPSSGSIFKQEKSYTGWKVPKVPFPQLQAKQRVQK